MTREEWMSAFTKAAKRHFKATGFPIPKNVRCSIGFTSKGERGKRIGECWADCASEDGKFEIFIKPSLQSDGSRVADILTHELIHAAVGLEHGHDRTFAKCAKALGLVGKMTATTAGPEWHKWADPILKKLGKFPGANLGSGGTSAAPKQTTRMLKLSCDHCDWTCRTSAKHVLEVMLCPSTCGGMLQQA